jgi:MFS transporter, Spinster family, sphingosine-1-phosphate transporter
MSISPRYAWYILILLTLLNIVNYMDRMVIVSMHDSLRNAFSTPMSEAQLGSFWFAFFTVHGLLLIPFGWASDRYNRIRIAAFGVLVWSFATLASAYALGFVSLFILRALIGVGEAAYGPVANVLLCEIFSAKQKARTIGIYNAGMFIGSCLGVALGGVLLYPLAFQVVALPGIVLGVLVLFLKIPSHRVDIDRTKQPSLSSVLEESWQALNRKTIRWLIGAGTLISFTAGAMIERVVDFMKEYKGFTDPLQASYVLGAVTLTAGVLGVIVGGIVADRLQRRYIYGRILAVAIGFTLAAPFALGVIFIDNGFGFYVSIWFLIFFLPWYNGPMAAVIDDVVDDDKASKAQASFACLLHIFGTGPASLVIGFAAGNLGWGLKYALLLPVSAILLAVFCCLMACRYVEGDLQRKAQTKALAATT